MEETAYHEAGHAFLATYLGGRVRSLTIEPDRDDGPERFGDATIEWRRDRMSTREFHEKLVLVALAGPVAEMLYRGEPLHPGYVAEWVEDWRLAWRAAELLVADERRRLAFLEDVTRQVYQMFDQTEAWAAIAALADELLAHETLEREQVRDVLSVWMH